MTAYNLAPLAGAPLRALALLAAALDHSRHSEPAAQTPPCALACHDLPRPVTSAAQAQSPEADDDPHGDHSMTTGPLGH